MGKFKKGLFLGGLFGAAMMWLNTTKKGKNVRKQLVDNAADVYDDLSEKIMASESWKNMTKTKYVKMAQEYVDKYAIENGLADSTKKMVKKLVVSQWGNLKGQAKSKKRK